MSLPKFIKAGKYFKLKSAEKGEGEHRENMERYFMKG